MRTFLTRFLICSALLSWSCKSEYKTLVKVPLDHACLKIIRPQSLETAWFDASVDVVGKHISGLLLVKRMPDSSTRVVFTNEAGVKFFDFEYPANGGFKVHQVLEMLDRKVVLNLLRKDFELILEKPFEDNDFFAGDMGGDRYFGVRDGDVNHYLVTGDCKTLKRLETGSNKKKMTTLKLFGSDSAKPDSLLLEHHTFAMQMRLKRLTRE